MEGYRNQSNHYSKQPPSNRVFMKKILALLTLFAGLNSCFAADNLIKNGRLISKDILADSWTKESKSITGSGTGNYLTCNSVIAAGDFTIEAEVVLDRVNGSASSFMLGSNHFGFDGHGKKLFMEGSDFPKKNLGSTSKFIKGGKPFHLKVARKSGNLTISIDGNKVISFKMHDDEIASFGFRPHRGSLSISDLKFDGKLSKLAELDYVFACNTDGYKSYRIPSIIKTKKGTLLASCEGRVHGSHDSGDIDLVLKRSTDHGKTWSKIKVIRDIKRTAGNPCPVVDQETGRITMVFCEMDHHEAHVIQGKSDRRVFTMYSDDDGIKWSKPKEITTSVNLGGKYNWLAAGPGVSIQIQKGKHKGRLVVPFANTIGHDFGVHTIYSDDKGETWKASNNIEGGCNESQLVELSNGDIMLNMRMQQNRKGYRGISISKDDGESWGELEHDDELNGPMCQGSIISLQGKKKRYLIFSNPATGGRNGMTIKVSADDGETWPMKKLIYPRSSGYSNVVVTDDGHVLCLFEGGPANYSKSGIASIRVPFSELKVK